MLFLKYLLLAGAIALFAVAIGLIVSIFYSQLQNRRRPEAEREEISSERNKHTFFRAARIGLRSGRRRCNPGRRDSCAWCWRRASL